MLKKSGRLRVDNRPGKSTILFVPAGIVRDSAFPFVNGKVTLEIVHSKIVVTQTPEQRGK